MATAVVSGTPTALQPPNAMPDPLDFDHRLVISNLAIPTPAGQAISPASSHAILLNGKANNNTTTVAAPGLQDASRRTASQGFRAPPGRDDVSDNTWAGAPATESESESADSSENLHLIHSQFNPFKPSPSLHIGSKGYIPPFAVDRVNNSPRREYGTSSDWSKSEASGEWSNRSPADPLQLLWTKLEEQRHVIQDHRVAMAKQRREMQRIHRRKDDEDNEFMQLLRPLLLSAGTLPRPYESLQRRLAELHHLRDEYNAAMSRYEALEEELDQHEIELESLERRFFTKLYGVTREDGQNDSDKSETDEEDARPPSRTSLLGISGDVKDDIHPLYRSLLDAVGDRELAYEHYTELVAHRDFILDDLETSLKRKRVQKNQSETAGGAAVLSEDELEGLKSAVAHIPTSISAPELKDLFGTSIRHPDLKFLMDFGREEEAARLTLEETTTEVRRLRDQCNLKGAMRKNPPFFEEYTIFMACGDSTSPPPSNMTIHSQSLTRTEDCLAHLEFPILLSNPSHVLEPEPLRPVDALRKAVKLPKDHPDRAQRMTQTMKEYDIAHLLRGTREQDKGDYINRWLLQQLRISPLQVRILLSAWPTRIKIKNVRRWQEDVLYYWTRDEAANQPAQVFDGPLTPDDYILLEDPVDGYANSVIDLLSRAESEHGDTPYRQDPARSTARSMF